MRIISYASGNQQAQIHQPTRIKLSVFPFSNFLSLPLFGVGGWESK